MLQVRINVNVAEIKINIMRRQVTCTLDGQGIPPPLFSVSKRPLPQEQSEAAGGGHWICFVRERSIFLIVYVRPPA